MTEREGKCCLSEFLLLLCEVPSHVTKTCAKLNMIMTHNLSLLVFIFCKNVSVFLLTQKIQQRDISRFLS